MMQVKVITVQGVQLDAMADAIHVRGIQGELTFLPHHADIIVQLRAGNVQVRAKDAHSDIELTNGYAYMHDGKLIIVGQK